MAPEKIAPIALFIFNRPELTARVHELIRKVRPEKLLVVADGPRQSRPQEEQRCLEAREIATRIDWTCELLTNFSAENLGCRRRVSSGLDWVFGQCAEAIVLEDDCLPSPSFFAFASSMLDRYRADARVMHVSGDNFLTRIDRPESYFFSRYAFSWGWATWRRAWQHYDVTVSQWPGACRDNWLSAFLDDPEETAYWADIFRRLYDGEIDTWDYQWLFACWRRNGLSILPARNLVSNIGVGPDATHYSSSSTLIGIKAHELDEVVHPSAVQRDQLTDRRFFRECISRQSGAAASGSIERLRQRVALRTRLRRWIRHLSVDRAPRQADEVFTASRFRKH